MPQLFILGRLRPGQYAFRLVGGLVDDLHGGHLGGLDPLRLWKAPYRTALQLALEAARRQPEPLVMTCDGASFDAGGVALEITIAPLLGPSGEVDRMIGLYQPLSAVAALRGQPIETLAIRSIVQAGRADETFPRLKLATINGRQIA